MLRVTHLKSAVDLLATVTMIAAGGLVVWRMYHSPSSAATSPQTPTVKELKNERIDSARITHTLGTGDVALVEFADYQCPYCARHAVQTFPDIKTKLIDQGMVRYVFINFPLTQIHPFAFKAAEAAECAAGQNKYWEMHERLFAHNTALTDA